LVLGVLTAQFQNQNTTPTLIPIGKDGQNVVLENVGLVRWLEVIVHISVLHLERVVALNLFSTKNTILLFKLHIL